MKLPLEKIVTTTVEQISAGVQLKISQIEEQRNREFTYQLKELEFYKSSYEMDLKDIFNYWFDLVRLTHIKDNKNLSSDEKLKFNNQYDDMIKVSEISKFKMNTLKYGGLETGRILALENTLHSSKYNDQPKMVALFVWCTILAVLKKDILGQNTDPIDIIRVLINDLYENDNFDKLIKSKNYVVKVYKEMYKQEPYWK